MQGEQELRWSGAPMLRTCAAAHPACVPYLAQHLHWPNAATLPPSDWDTSVCQGPLEATAAAAGEARTSPHARCSTAWAPPRLQVGGQEALGVERIQGGVGLLARQVAAGAQYHDRQREPRRHLQGLGHARRWRGRGWR